MRPYPRTAKFGVLSLLLVMLVGCGRPTAGTRRWLGREYWANRLQDWQFARGRMECLVDRSSLPVRTAFLLTREVAPGPGDLRLGVRTGMLGPKRNAGWSGFLIGIGSGRLDYRAAALVHCNSGQGGGIMAVFEADGRCNFRDHSSEIQPRRFDPLPNVQITRHLPYRRSPGEEVELSLVVAPSAGQPGRFDLALTATDVAGGKVISEARLAGVPEKRILGGIALVSHPGRDENVRAARAGARYWFRDVQVGGSKVRTYPDRAWGPIAAALFSLNGRVLRMNAQFMPLGATVKDAPREYTAARLEYRPVGPAGDSPGAWREGPVSRIEPPSQTALFRVPDWDSRRAHEYRIVPLRPDGSPAPPSHWYFGRVPADPIGKDPLVIAAFTGCYFMGRCPDRRSPSRPTPAGTRRR